MRRAFVKHQNGLIAATALRAALCGAAALAQAAPLEVQVSDAQGRPLPGAVVFVQAADARQKLPPVQPLQGVEVAQVERRFDPAVSVVTVGTAVTFPNRDTVRHHVYSFSATKKFEIKLYVGTPSAPVVFDQPGIGVLGCNIHDHMAAWVVVLDTPYHTRSDAEGRAVIADLPAGKYRLRAWHPALPVGDVPSEQALTMTAAAVRVAVQLAAAKP